MFEAVDMVGKDMFGSDWTDAEREERKRPLTETDIDAQAELQTIDAITRGDEGGTPDKRSHADIREDIQTAARATRPQRQRRWAANERIRKLLNKGDVKAVAFDGQSGNSHPILQNVWVAGYVDDVFITGHIDVVTSGNADVSFRKWQGEGALTWWVLVREDQLTRALAGDPNPSVEWSVEELTNSGATGPRTAMSLVLAEFDRRAQRGLLQDSATAEASHLNQWVRKAYPKLHVPTAKTIYNNLIKEQRFKKAKHPK